MKRLQTIYQCDECGTITEAPPHTINLPLGWIELLGVKHFNTEGARHVCGVSCLAKYAADVAGGKYFSFYDINTGKARKELGE